jgi:two-component system OmpR family response regulator
MQPSALKTVLYVDDEADIRQIVQIALELSGTLQVITADSGEQALDLARTRKPDLILLDVMMPGIDGPSTLKRLRTDHSIDAIPVVFMTAKALPHEVAGLRELGALGVIAKPFDPMQLEAQVQALWQEAHTRAASMPQPDKVEEIDEDEEVQALREAFIARTRHEVVAMRDLLSRSTQGDRDALVQLEKLTHRIHGTGAVFGFSAISDCAEVIERMTERLLAQNGTGESVRDTQAVRDLQARYEQLAAEVSSIPVAKLAS